MEFTPAEIFYCIYAFNLLSFIWEFWLGYRQYRVHYENEKRPSHVTEIISEEDYNKARLYKLDKHRFSFFKSIFGQIETSLILWFNLTAYFWYISGDFTKKYYGDSEIVQSIAFCFVQSFIDTIISLPFEYYDHFVIEEKFGFNKQTVSFFFVDRVKKFAVSLVLGVPVISGIIWIIKAGGPYFFVYVWLFISFVILVMMTIYPEFIAPLFDKYTPLPESDLKTKIEALAGRLEFPLKKLYVVEGSKRSSHSNAYMYGFWKNKRIVLFDTLLSKEMNEHLKSLHKTEPTTDKKTDEVVEGDEKPAEKQDEVCFIDSETTNFALFRKRKTEPKSLGMTDNEVIAVLGHELGHWKLSHTMFNLAIAEVNLFLMLMVFSYFYKNDAIYKAFGFTTQPILIGLALIMQYVLSLYNEILSLIMSWLSRQMEFGADEFAAKLGYAPQLITGLIKLGKDNLSMPIDDWLYSATHHSHPPTPERILALKKYMLRSRHLLLRSCALVQRAHASTVPGSNASVTIKGKPASEVYDEKSDKLQAIDIEDLPRAQKRFAIQFEKINEERIKEIFKKNYKNIIGFTILACAVVGIYYYTIYAVKQETFLEEIDEEMAQERGEVPPSPAK
ncbi:CAAX prenyl protease 1-like protein [Aphelenchoides bicaudatus]|nr:CAAX prenyl protease 1-like protein [Aphelenchoides bicaudatus]